MEWDQSCQAQGVQMTQKHKSLSFMGRRSIAPRPLSEATEIFDTDNEDDDSLPRSMGSMDGDSHTTVSTPEEVHTPHSAGLGDFEFHFDEKPVKGPNGPHLFRPSPELQIRFDQDDCVDLSISPVDAPARPISSAHLPQTRPFSSLNRAVAELDESQVRSWSPSQVADWMQEAGFEDSVVEKFLTHDISGLVLLDLQFEDLKELDITSFGKRHRVMSSIQHLRNSSMFSSDWLISASVPPPRSASVRTPPRRARSARPQLEDVISPADSVSIVAIEQVLPKPPQCGCESGEDCKECRKYQRKLARIQKDFGTVPDVDAGKLVIPVSASTPTTIIRPVSDAVPSVVRSSDALGPAGLPITAETLNAVEPRDPQDYVRKFLSFQHMQSTSPVKAPSPPPASSASFVASPPQPQPAQLASNLRHLPKLTIPVEDPIDQNPTPSTVRRHTKTPISAIRHTSQTLRLQANLESDPYHYGNVASPADLYRTEMPFSATDIPVTQHAIDPVARDVSQSVPAEMRYGAEPVPFPSFADPIARPSTAHGSMRRHHYRQNSFTPSVAPLPETAAVGTRAVREHRPEPPVAPLKLEDVQHSGWMRKRKTTRLLRHEWQDHHCTLKGTRLAIHKDESKTLEVIDVDEFAVACSSLASSSKLSAAFKRSLLGKDKSTLAAEQAFAFSLVPQAEENKKLFANSKSHHFSVNTRDDRIDWMRELMLAKALKRGKESGNEIRVNGHLI